MFLAVFVSEAMTGPEPRDGKERRACLHRVFGDAGWECPQILRAMEAVEDIYFDRVSQVSMPQWSKGHVALIGDAAACVSFLAGEGAGLALLEAYVLAGELNRAKGDHQEAFCRYEQRMRPLIERKTKVGPELRRRVCAENTVRTMATQPGDDASGYSPFCSFLYRPDPAKRLRSPALFNSPPVAAHSWRLIAEPL